MTEYGTVKDEAQFRAMYAYSPLHNVKERVYPAVLLTTGETNPRVDPYQSRKMAARLRAANTGPNPILLRSRSGNGPRHGHASVGRDRGTDRDARVPLTSSMHYWRSLAGDDGTSDDRGSRSPSAALRKQKRARAA